MTESKVQLHFTITLDGFIAGPNHEMDWLGGLSGNPELVTSAAAACGAIITGRTRRTPARTPL
jgi:hypothetical protein